MKYASIYKVPGPEIWSWYAKHHDDDDADKELRHVIVGDIRSALRSPSEAHKSVGHWGCFKGDGDAGTVDAAAEEWAYDALEALGVQGFTYEDCLRRTWSLVGPTDPFVVPDLAAFAKACGVAKADLARGARALKGKREQ